jgi:hypothetical protein
MACGASRCQTSLDRLQNLDLDGALATAWKQHREGKIPILFALLVSPPQLVSSS